MLSSKTFAHITVQMQLSCEKRFSCNTQGSLLCFPCESRDRKLRAFTDGARKLHQTEIKLNKINITSNTTKTFRFRPGTAKEQIRSVLNEELSGKTYDSSEAGQLTKHIADVIKAKLKGAKWRPSFRQYHL